MLGKSETSAPLEKINRPVLETTALTLSDLQVPIIGRGAEREVQEGTRSWNKACVCSNEGTLDGYTIQAKVSNQ